VTSQNFRSKARELASLEKLQQQNRSLRQAKRAVELSSERDGLTGLFNRGSFDRDILKLNGQERPYALAMVDVDHFKSYNDSHGHRAGDRVLRRVGEALAAAVARPGDRVYRYGGEEFIVLLPGTDWQGAEAALERCRQQIENLAIEHRLRPDGLGRVTISAGVADVAEAGHEQVIDLADQRLYQAKSAGRNRIQAQDQSRARLGGIAP
jgi:diguanylate cyclase (GGDEF)-like protein